MFIVRIIPVGREVSEKTITKQFIKEGASLESQVFRTTGGILSEQYTFCKSRKRSKTYEE